MLVRYCSRNKLFRTSHTDKRNEHCKKYVQFFYTYKLYNCNLAVNYYMLFKILHFLTLSQRKSGVASSR